MKIILASASPRRKILLEQLGLDFIIKPSEIDETKFNLNNPIKLVQKLSYLKADDVYSSKEEIVIAADTVVSKDDLVLGKPADKDEARKMLKSLSNTTHEVISGITIIAGGEVRTSYERTNVTFKKLTNQEIDDYIATGEPLDKAGAYGIQAKGAVLVKKIDGCFYNVVGLSLYRVVEMMKELGWEIELNGLLSYN